MFTKMFERSLINIEEKFKEDLIEFDYTFYFIFEYISYVLFKFTHDGVFQKMEYFKTVFLKNIDVWGFIMTYLPIIEYLEPYYKQLCECEKEIFHLVCKMILYAIECSYVPIDQGKVLEMLNKLNELFLQAKKKSTTHFLEKIRSSSSGFSTTYKTKKHSKTALTKTVSRKKSSKSI